MFTLRTFTDDNPSIFSGMYNPVLDGFREQSLQAIMLECGDMIVSYPDPGIMCEKISRWVDVNGENWKSLYNTTLLEYDPISNYDRTEEWEHESESAVDDSAISDTSNTHKVAAFNNAEMSESNTDIFSSMQNGNSSSHSKRKHKARMYGNIGVTTTQQMIEAERNVVAFNVANVIAQSFKEHFCLLIY